MMMQARGVNMRYLGHIATQTRKSLPALARLCVSEMIGTCAQ